MKIKSKSWSWTFDLIEDVLMFKCSLNCYWNFNHFGKNKSIAMKEDICSILQIHHNTKINSTIDTWGDLLFKYSNRNIALLASFLTTSSLFHTTNEQFKSAFPSVNDGTSRIFSKWLSSNSANSINHAKVQNWSGTKNIPTTASSLMSIATHHIEQIPNLRY